MTPVAAGVGRELQDGRAARDVEQAERHAAGAVVQRNEESLIEFTLKTEDLRYGADDALRPGLQRGFARPQPEQRTHARVDAGSCCCDSTHRRSASATTGSQGSPVVKPAPGPT